MRTLVQAEARIQHLEKELADAKAKAEQSQDLAIAAKQEFLSAKGEDEGTADLAAKHIKGSKLQAAQSLTYLIQHAESENVMLSACKYVLDFDRIEATADDEDSFEKLVAKLNATD